MNKSYLILVIMSCLSTAFQGNVQLCVHQQKYAGSLLLHSVQFDLWRLERSSPA